MRFFSRASFLAFALVSHAKAQSTSPGLVVETRPSDRKELTGDPTVPITFSEFSVGTTIADQYSESKGVIFGGEGTTTFITQDASNPTSPVLSGTPLFNGEIYGRFVDSDGNDATVKSFEFDGGYFDEVGSTRLSWFDPDGTLISQAINTGNGIEHLKGEGGNIASFRIGIFENEPAGYAIDNFASEPAESGILFREKSGDGKDGTFGFLDDEIPGFDHVAFSYKGDVYESHPGYLAGTYQSADGEETVAVAQENGVQQEFTRATFAHNSMTAATKVVKFTEIGLSDEDAENIKTAIETVLGSASFQGIDFSSTEGIVATLNPDAQKGGGNSFTCVGLIEWAAEQAGINGGQGFIPDGMESVGGFPLLSPELLYYSMKGADLLDKAEDIIKGFFDPIDFIVTDPLGRRLGTANGERYEEIPNAYLSDEGNLQYVIIPNPLPGTYSIELFSADPDEQGVAVVGIDKDGSETILVAPSSNPENPTESCTEVGEVEVSVGSTGDVNLDGMVDQDDVTALSGMIPIFTDGLGDPGDLNGDGVLDSTDVALLQQYIDNAATPTADACPEFVPGPGDCRAASNSLFFGGQKVC